MSWGTVARSARDSLRVPLIVASAISSMRVCAEALERVLAPNGLVARLDGNVAEIGPLRKLGEKRSFTGAAISFDYKDKDLDEVPWDQAFDLLVRLNGLTWTQTGDVIRVEPPRRAPSR